MSLHASNAQDDWGNTLAGEAERLQGVTVDVLPAAAALGSQEKSGAALLALPDLAVSLQQQAEAPLREGLAGVLACSIQVPMQQGEDLHLWLGFCVRMIIPMHDLPAVFLCAGARCYGCKGRPFPLHRALVRRSSQPAPGETGAALYTWLQCLSLTGCVFSLHE